MKKRRFGVKFKFTVVFSAFIAVVMLFGASYMNKKQKDLITSLSSKKGNSITNLIASAAHSHIEMDDIRSIDLLIKNVLSDDDIAFVFVTGPNNELISSFRSGMNIISDEFQAWGISADDPKRSVNSLMNDERIFSYEQPVSSFVNAGKIKIGLFRDRMGKEASGLLSLMLIITAIVVVTLALISHFMFKKMVSNPIDKIILVSNSLANGNLKDVVDIKNSDEIGDVAGGINLLSTSLKDIVTEMRQLIDELQEAGHTVNGRANDVTNRCNDQLSMITKMISIIDNNTSSLRELAGQTNELKQSSEDTSASIMELVSSSSEISLNMDTLAGEIDEISGALQQISNAINTLVEVVEMVSESTDETSSSAHEIDASIKQIENLTNESREIIEDIKRKTEKEGLGAIEETIEGMKKIKDSVEITDEIISILDSKSLEIDKILQVIDEVTDRTTLLSLNAAILAAQAGQHGKSFSVVASEIKTLASDTSSSTQEIGGIITMIQKEIKTAVNSISQGIGMVSNGLKLAEQAGDIFNGISAGTNEASEYSERIHSALQEQASGISLVTKTAESIAERVGGLFVFVKEQKDAIDRMMLSVANIREVAHRVKSSTDEQKRASTEISVASEDVSSMSSAIAIALNVLSDKSSELVEMVDKIRSSAEDSVNVAGDVSSSMEQLSGKASSLSDAISKFNI
ncbi:MAG: HAMP domain-containing protein [Nitrospirota bacterium]|nr:MAG: HAMP domain-containing protein [Nitrospirota bacterium]